MSGTERQLRDGGKEQTYYANQRADVIDILPRPAGRVLDVGCGAGATAGGLRAAGGTEIVGVEPQAGPAARAREVLDLVVEDSIESALAELQGPFDTVLCLDVLEHLAEPVVVLQDLLALARPGGHLQVSVPNARHFSLVLDLVFRGTFGYRDWGHRDDTHLRWFTRSDMRTLLERCGWEVVAQGYPPLGRSRVLHRLTVGRSSEFLVAQVYATGRKPG